MTDRWKPISDFPYPKTNGLYCLPDQWCLLAKKAGGKLVSAISKDAEFWSPFPERPFFGGYNAGEAQMKRIFEEENQ